MTCLISAGSSPRGRGTRRRDRRRRRIRRFIPARAGNTENDGKQRDQQTVHPRAGGEHSNRIRKRTCACGSSPRGRGTPRLGGRLRGRRRFIPARAGNTPDKLPGLQKTAVHPRAGGEHRESVSRGWTIIGSSPRGRGTRCWLRFGLGCWRFIPARAGNTIDCRTSQGVHAVHPRAGGEHAPRLPAEGRSTGSSPRGRGTPSCGFARIAGIRFIPARAGNTRASRSTGRRRPVHPRAGGEHESFPLDRETPAGSSPRGRGTHAKAPDNAYARGFIPARAGNTASGRWTLRYTSVHPRAGGEHAHATTSGSCGPGSSPRGRGTPNQDHRSQSPTRFIPARAGNTSRKRRSTPTRSVHPRAGGEHSRAAMRYPGKYGSSPRGRGTLFYFSRSTYHVRFIPARAGNTCPMRWRVSLFPVHPRAGGEHGPASGLGAPSHGSSPRGRGTRRGGGRVRLVCRFIPARAGNTWEKKPTAFNNPVHPRAGGEHERPLDRVAWQPGSSPRGRGTQQTLRFAHLGGRFIPARAGNTAPARGGASTATVHPRAGGEHTTLEALNCEVGNSSPRGRGTRLALARLPGVRRFIPARAGNTAPCGPTPSRLTVHPRAGGEHGNRRAAVGACVGSSPRGRGTHIAPAVDRSSTRFIPARAGNTRGIAA